MMKFLSKRQVIAMVLYSAQHIARLEAAGQFPKRVQLGDCRVGWANILALRADLAAFAIGALAIVIRSATNILCNEIPLHEEHFTAQHVVLAILKISAHTRTC